MKASLTVTHDRLTIKISNGMLTLNLTVSRKGETVSGRGQTEQTLRAALAAFGKFIRQGGTTYGDRMNDLKTIAESTDSFDTFITRIG